MNSRQKEQKNLPCNPAVPTGDFSTWLQQFRQSLLEGLSLDVACGDCSGCCTSSYFIHIKPTDTAALKNIPGEILFPAPGKAKGHMLMGYDDKGHCPMLKQGKCSIYAHRPLTCRQYDCRIFAATGIFAAKGMQSVINERAMRWVFSYSTERSQAEHSAVKKVAAFIRDNPHYFPGGRVPEDPGQLAILAIKSYEVCLEEAVPTDAECAERIVSLCRQFDEKITG